MNGKNEKKVGRKKRTSVEALKTKAWFNAVSAKSKMKTNSLEKRFRQLGGDVRTASLWYKYANGSVTPGPHVVNQVEETYFGTEYWLKHQIWRLMVALPSTYAEMKYAFFELSKKVRELLVMEGQDFFWRRTDDAKTTSALLLAARPIEDAVTGTILFIHEALEFKQDRQQFEHGKEVLELLFALMEKESSPFSQGPDRDKSISQGLKNYWLNHWPKIVNTNGTNKRSPHVNEAPRLSEALDDTNRQLPLLD